MLVSSIDTEGIPVSPINKLTKHGHCKWVNGCADNDFTVGTHKRGPLNLLSIGKENNGNDKALKYQNNITNTKNKQAVRE